MLSALRTEVERSYPREEYPALAAQCGPGALPDLAGRRVLDATPCWRNTLPRYLALLSAGADLTVGVDSGIPHDPEVVAFVESIGIAVDGPAAPGYDVVMDCAGLHSGRRPRFGTVELTRSGADPYAAATTPVVLVDAGRIKKVEDLLGTGDGFVRALAALDIPLKGAHLLVFGGGKVGLGICWRAAAAGAQVTVVDPHVVEVPASAHLVSASDRDAVRDLIAVADVIVTATGVTDSLAGYAPDLLATGAVLTNMGATDEYGPGVPTSRVLNDKAPLNFVLAEPTRLRYLESSLALSNAAADWLVARATRGPGAPAGIQPPDAELEAPILEATVPGLSPQERAAIGM